MKERYTKINHLLHSDFYLMIEYIKLDILSHQFTSNEKTNGKVHKKLTASICTIQKLIRWIQLPRNEQKNRSHTSTYDCWNEISWYLETMKPSTNLPNSKGKEEEIVKIQKTYIVSITSYEISVIHCQYIVLCRTNNEFMKNPGAFFVKI